MTGDPGPHPGAARTPDPRTDTAPVRVIVAIPARDEADALPGCLDHVAAALDSARAARVLAEAAVVVAAHRSTDGTEAVARGWLARHAAAGGPVGVVLRDEESPTVADVRRAAVAAGLDALPAAGREPQRAWVFSTDADSAVPPDWITGLLAAARAADAVAAAGLVEVTDWDAGPEAARAYARIVAAGIHGETHDHVYGASLAVRLDAYLAVGGFPGHVHGEDHALVRRLRAAGHGVATPLAPVVATSGRADPRCARGLGALLRDLGASAGSPPLRA